MPRAKKKPTLKRKNSYRNAYRKNNRKNKKRTRKARGYTNECVIPAPQDDIEEKESCKKIDLQDDYGNSVLMEKGISGDKECNMYYYIHNGKYYRCRNAGRNKCNKTGKMGMRRLMCNNISTDRIDSENQLLEGELQDLINPSARYPSVPRNIPNINPIYPTVPTHSPMSNIVLPSVPTTDVRSTLKRPTKSLATPSTIPVSNMPQSSRTTRKQSVKMMPSKNKKQLETTIDKLVNQNQQYRAKKEELTNKVKSRGNVSKQMERQMKITIARQNKMYDDQIKKNEAMIKNLTRMSQI